MNKHISTGAPATMSLQNALSEGNHKGRSHGTEDGNIKPGTNQPCSFSTVLQAFWHQKQTIAEPARSCDHSLSYLFLPSPLVKLAAAAAL